ncbi:MAG TPA: hypothetical protein VIJ54_06895, partial [Actinomycetes bacterium]
TPKIVTMAYMVVLGVGIGLVMQVLILAAQNASQRRDLGVTTSTVSFFRSIGGSVGIAVFGSIFNRELASRLGENVPSSALAKVPTHSLSVKLIDALPEALRHGFVLSFAEALTRVFLYAVPFVLLSFALSWLIREVPLRTNAEHAAETVAARATGPDAEVGAAIPG